MALYTDAAKNSLLRSSTVITPMFGGSVLTKKEKSYDAAEFQATSAYEFWAE